MWGGGGSGVPPASGWGCGAGEDAFWHRRAAVASGLWFYFGERGGVRQPVCPRGGWREVWGGDFLGGGVGKRRVPPPALPHRRLAQLRVGVRERPAVAAIAGHGEGGARPPAEDLPWDGVQRARHPRLGAGGVGVRDHIRVPLVF